MHKKLADDLTSLAHSILRMKDKDDVFALKAKAHEVYEKLALLAYVEEYINTTPNAEVTKEELIAKIVEAETLKKEEITETIEAPTLEIVNEEVEFVALNEVEETPDIKTEEQEVIEEAVKSEAVKSEVVVEEVKEEEKPVVSEIEEQPFDELESILFEDPKFKNEAQFIEERKTPTLEEELGDTISVDVMANLFEKVEPKKTLHDKLQNTIQVGLNDRIAFVKNLFDGNQEDFNRVISQLNTIDNEKEAKDFINTMVKPEYDWSEKEEYETRLLELIERRFTV